MSTHFHTRGEEMACPHCGAGLDCHDGIGDAVTPDAGSISICARCICVSVYAQGTDGLYLRKLTDEEAPEVMRNPTVMKARTILASSGRRLSDVIRTMRGGS